MILHANLARFRGNLVAGALDRAKSSPTNRVDRPAVSLTDKTVALELEKEIPRTRHPISLGHEAGAIALA